ncbi:MAG: hypothetical protein LJE62_11885, partial [Silicimonas sp.]|nr:hypothetical protein [Silicimonas sp.]
ASVPVVSAMVDELSALGIPSEYNLKKTNAAQSKVSRPATRQKYPWFELRHIRDFLRFRSGIRSTDDLEKVLGLVSSWIENDVAELVKYDLKKISQPSVFGWRVLVFDFRLSETGLLVEYYVTFEHMIHANQEWLHSVFEKWREKDLDTLKRRERKEFDHDALFSFLSYESMFVDSATKDGTFFDDKEKIDGGVGSVISGVEAMCP